MSGLILFADTQRSAAMRHEVPLSIPDPFLFVGTDGRRAVLTNMLERDRIAAELPDAEILDMVELGVLRLIGEGRSRTEATHEVVLRALERLGVRETTVPGTFP